MKTVLVTSAVTYVPENYLEALRGALNGAREEIAGLILLQNFEPKLVVQSAGLYAMGCRNFATTLTKNMMSLVRDPRRELFAAAGLPVLSFSSMNDDEAVRWVNENEIDLLVNMRTRCIYRTAILRSPRLGCINIHHGLLPEYRGTMCDLYALADDRPAGFSIHVMNEKIDAGAILHREVVSSGQHDEKDYLAYLGKTSVREGEVLARLLQETKSSGRLPEGTVNQSSNAIFTRNPGRQRIREMQTKGVRL